MSDGMKMFPGAITFGPTGDAPERIREILKSIPTLPYGKAAQDEVLRLRRRVAALEARLARVLHAATRAHNHHAREGFRGVLRPYGNVWSGKRRGGGR